MGLLFYTTIHLSFNNNLTSQQNIRLGRSTALISFLLGTGVFGLYFLTSAFELLFLGYGFIILAGLVNIGILTSLLIKGHRDRDNRKKLRATCGIMLLNIPVMLVYCWLSFVLLDTVRITFTNKTQTTVTDINIVGCQPKHIDKLEPDEHKTVWVAITGDCSIDINYISNGQRKHENVAGYVTNSMGQKIEHKLGIPNEMPF